MVLFKSKAKGFKKGSASKLQRKDRLERRNSGIKHLKPAVGKAMQNVLFQGEWKAEPSRKSPLPMSTDVSGWFL